jgi:hypothetical protein
VINIKKVQRVLKEYFCHNWQTILIFTLTTISTALLVGAFEDQGISLNWTKTLLVLSVILAAKFRNVQYSNLHTFHVWFIKLTTAYFLYWTATLFIPDTFLEGHEHTDILYFKYIAIALGLYSLWRSPLFAFPMFLYLLCFKTIAYQYTEVVFIGNINLQVGVILFNLLGLFVINGLNRYKTNIFENVKYYGEVIALCSISIWLCNYVGAAYYKTVIGDYLFQWVLENKTFDLSLSADGMNILPFPLKGLWGDFVINGLGKFEIIFTTFVVIVEYIVIVHAFVRRITPILLVAATGLHLSILLFSGVNFYTWIIFNVILLISWFLGNLEIKQRFLLLMGFAVAPMIFPLATLAWFDTPSLLDRNIVAETKDGRMVKLDPHFFLLGRGVFWHGDFIGMPKVKGHFRSGILGSGVIDEPNILSQLQNCEYVQKEGRLAEYIASNSYSFKSYLLKLHNYYKKEGPMAAFKLPAMRFFPSRNYTRYLSLNFNNVVAYHYLMESKCMYWDGETKAKLIKRDMYKLMSVK